MRTQGILLVLLVLTASSALAQERCLLQDTPRQCLQKLIVARAYETAKANEEAANTGPSSVTSPIRSAVKDFLSVASAHLDGSSVKEGDKSLIIDYNLPGTILGAHRQVNLEATIAEPVASPVVSAEAANNLTLADAVQQLGRGDDVTAALSFNPVTEHFGRGIDGHRALFNSMLLSVIATTPPATAAVPASSFDTPFAQIVPDSAAQAAAVAEFETAANTALSPAAEQLTTDFTRLSDNQPQLYVTVHYRYRKPLEGPRDRGARVTWEIATDNINTFRRAEGRDCETKGNCYAALHDYVARRGNRTSRLALSIGYFATWANDPGILAPAVEEVPTHGLTYSVTYGQEVTAFAGGRQARIDLTLIHQGGKTTATHGLTSTSTDVTAARNGLLPSLLIPPSSTRSSAALTFTQPVSDRFSVPVAVVVADRVDSLLGTGSFVSPEVPGAPFTTRRRVVEVHGGIRYQIPQFSPQRPQQCCCK